MTEASAADKAGGSASFVGHGGAVPASRKTKGSILEDPEPVTSVPSAITCQTKNAHLPSQFR